jgi:hypothetical protein
MRPATLSALKPIALALCCFALLAPAAPAQEAKPPAPTPQQNIESRRIVIYNGATRQVQYNLNGLPPDQAAAYRKMGYLENEATLAENLQQLKATYVSDAFRPTSAFSGTPYLGTDYYGSYTSGSPVQAAVMPSIGAAASSDYALTTIDMLQAAQERVLKSEQELLRRLGQSGQPPVPVVPAVAGAKPASQLKAVGVQAAAPTHTEKAVQSASLRLETNGVPPLVNDTNDTQLAAIVASTITLLVFCLRKS